MSQNSKKNITITDIAQAAGVSKTTVSRYLNGKFDMMSQDTRSRIDTVIRIAAQMLLGMIRDENFEKQDILLPSEPIIRDSTQLRTWRANHPAF